MSEYSSPFRYPAPLAKSSSPPKNAVSSSG